MQRYILVILDGSPLGEAALPYAAALARATSSGLTLLQVILPIEVVCSGAGHVGSCPCEAPPEKVACHAALPGYGCRRSPLGRAGGVH